MSSYQEYIQLWSFQASELQNIQISFNPELDKIFCTALITYSQNNPFRTKGFSILLKQVNQYNKLLKNLVSGKFDDTIEKFTIETNQKVFSKIKSNYTTKPYQKKSNKPTIEYLEIIRFNSTDVVIPIVSYMCSPNPYYQNIKFNEDIIKSKFSSNEEYIQDKKNRDEENKLNQKFYFNATKSFGEDKTWRTRGFSLQRQQISKLIEALDSIHKGEIYEKIASIKKSIRESKKSNSDVKQKIKKIGLSNGKKINIDDEILVKTTRTSNENTRKKINTDSKPEKREEKMTDDEIEVRKKNQLSDEEFERYMEDIKKHSAKMNKK